MSDVQDSNTLFSMNTSNMNNMQSFYLHQPVQNNAGSDLNALNSYGFGNRKPPGFSATEHIDANDLNTGKPLGSQLPSTSIDSMRAVEASTKHTIPHSLKASGCKILVLVAMLMRVTGTLT